MDLNQLTRDADELIRKVVSRYNQLYVPAGNISQVELDLMLDDMRRLYETFKTIGYVNLSLQNASNKPEVSVKSVLPKEAEKTVADFTVFSEPPVKQAEPVTAKPLTEPLPEPQPELPQQQQPEPVAELQPEPTPEPTPQYKQELKEEFIPKTELTEEEQPEFISEPEFENEAVTETPAPIEPEIKKTAPLQSHHVTPANKQEQTPAMLADKFNIGNKSLSETMGSSQAQGGVGSRMMYHPISDLSSGIGLNDKFSFISELFGNNPAQYDEAITRINKAVNADEASWILNKYQSNDWEQKQESLTRFKDFIKRRFI
jgi:hypothetical protein